MTLTDKFQHFILRAHARESNFPRIPVMGLDDFMDLLQ